MASTITYDTSTDGGYSATTSLTYSHTVGAGSNSYLFVGVLYVGSTDAVTGITYNGVAMARISYSPSDAQDGEVSYVYGLVNPATGAHNVVVTNNLAGGGMTSAAISYFGTAQTGQPDNSANPAAVTPVTSITASLTVNKSGSWLLGFFRTGTSQSVVAGTTARANAGGSPTALFVDSNGGLLSGSQSLGTTFSSSYAKYIIISIKDLSVTSSGYFRTLMGVGR